MDKEGVKSLAKHNDTALENSRSWVDTIDRRKTKAEYKSLLEIITLYNTEAQVSDRVWVDYRN